MPSVPSPANGPLLTVPCTMTRAPKDCVVYGTWDTLPFPHVTFARPVLEPEPQERSPFPFALIVAA